jgi:hypothetical protein
MIVKETLLVEYIVRVDDGNTVFMSGGQEYLDKIVGILSEHRAFLEHVRTVEAANKDLRETNDVLAAKLDSLIIVNCQALACSAPVAAEVERLRAKWQAAVHSEEVFLKMQDRIVAEATAELQTEVERRVSKPRRRNSGCKLDADCFTPKHRYNQGRGYRCRNTVCRCAKC